MNDRSSMPVAIRCGAIALVAIAAIGSALGSDDDLGRRLYAEGRNARGDALRSLAGLPPSVLAGERAACIRCHGADARGTNSIPDLRWRELAGRDGRARPAGRLGVRYDARSFAQAVNEGVDPAGAPLGASMPRYSLSATEMAALIDYLKTL